MQRVCSVFECICLCTPTRRGCRLQGRPAMTGHEHAEVAVHAMQAAAYHLGQALDLEAEPGSYRTYPHPETRQHLRTLTHTIADLKEAWDLK